MTSSTGHHDVGDGVTIKVDGDEAAGVVTAVELVRARCTRRNVRHMPWISAIGRRPPLCWLRLLCAGPRWATQPSPRRDTR